MFFPHFIKVYNYYYHLFTSLALAVAYHIIIIYCVYLTGTSVQFCSGINDANKGVQLSYLNDDSDEWIQIAYFSDTIYFMVSIIIINM